MSIIGEQVHYLRSLAGEKSIRVIPEIAEALEEAADTIEDLHNKLNEESGWVPCSKRLPKVEVSDRTKAGVCSDNGRKFLVTDTEGYVYESTFYAVSQKFKDNVIAWRSMPEPYKDGGNGND